MSCLLLLLRNTTFLIIYTGEFVLQVRDEHGVQVDPRQITLLGNQPLTDPEGAAGKDTGSNGYLHVSDD